MKLSEILLSIGIGLVLATAKPIHAQEKLSYQEFMDKYDEGYTGNYPTEKNIAGDGIVTFDEFDEQFEKENPIGINFSKLSAENIQAVSAILYFRAHDAFSRFDTYKDGIITKKDFE